MDAIQFTAPAFSVYIASSTSALHLHQTFSDAYRLAGEVGGEVVDEATGEVLWEASTPASFSEDIRRFLAGEGDPVAMEQSVKEAYLMDETFAWAVAEFARLARRVREAGSVVVPMDGWGDCSVEDYYGNILDTFKERGIHPVYNLPDFVDAAEAEYLELADATPFLPEVPISGFETDENGSVVGWPSRFTREQAQLIVSAVREARRNITSGDTSRALLLLVGEEK